jgi:hypothetical protein
MHNAQGGLEGATAAAASAGFRYLRENYPIDFIAVFQIG